MRGTDDSVRWVIQAQCGDRDAMEHVLRAIQVPLRRYVAPLVGSTATDDVLQTALIAVAKHLEWLAEPRLFRPWAYRIASRAAFDHLRKEKRRGLHDSNETLLDNLAAAEPRPSGIEIQELLDSAEVSAILELSLGTVKSRLAYGLAALRRHLAEKKESPYG